MSGIDQLSIRPGKWAVVKSHPHKKHLLSRICSGLAFRLATSYSVDPAAAFPVTLLSAEERDTTDTAGRANIERQLDECLVIDAPLNMIRSNLAPISPFTS